MPLYQHIILTLPKANKNNLSDVFRRYADIAFAFKGNLRGIENHGIRNLPERTKRKYPALDGTRYFWDARYVTVTVDASPTCLTELERFLKTEEVVLRQHVIKAKTNVDLSKATNYKNPYTNV